MTKSVSRWKRFLKTTPDRRRRTRDQAMLMASRGRRHRQIAEDLRLSGRTLQRWLHAYQAQGLAGLKLRWVSGRTAKIPEAMAPEILTWVQAGPAGRGLDRAHWTSAALATYLTGREWREPTLKDVQQTHGQVSGTEWTGVPLSTLFREVGVQPGARWCIAEGADAARMNRSHRRPVPPSTLEQPP
jgi:transposase